MNKKMYTLIEILIVLLIISIITLILYSIFSNYTKLSHRSSCISNEKSIGTAVQMYIMDNDQTLPPVSLGDVVGNLDQGKIKWFDLIAVYIKKMPNCPDIQKKDKFIYTSGYCFNGRLNSMHIKKDNTGNFSGVNESIIRNNSNTVLITDCRTGFHTVFSPDLYDKYVDFNGIYEWNNRFEIQKMKPGAFRHNEGAIYLFIDGHVKWLTLDDFKKTIGKENHPTFYP
jgi:prepilin-type processing-associated H-X9-DG protein/prepilin-type N-terminal cleavage/methylation domain-containing protein